jgi:hypothetical protein
MFALNEIVEMNRKAAAKGLRHEDNHNRECSYSGDIMNGVVLHSARFRNTVFLRPKLAKHFIRQWNSVNSQEARNRIVEGYFE